jgi:preprotein translocase subunit SecD
MTNTRIGVELTILLLVLLGFGWLVMLLFSEISGPGSTVDPQISANPQPLSRLSFARVADSWVDAGTSQLPYPAKESEVLVIDRWQLEPSDIEAAKATVDDTGSPALSVTLTEAAGDQMREYSRRMIGQRMAMIIDDQVVVLAVVNDAVSGKFVISGTFSRAEIRDLVRSLDRTHR